jgi:hypothetical protein
LEIIGLSLTALVLIAMFRAGYGAIYGKGEIGEGGYVIESILVSPTLLTASDNKKTNRGSYLEQNIHVFPYLEMESRF